MKIYFLDNNLVAEISISGICKSPEIVSFLKSKPTTDLKLKPEK